MANPTPSISPAQNFAPDQTVQTGAQEGEWMFLQRASELTGLSEKTLRRYIKKRVLKSRRLGKQTNSPLQVWVTAETLQTFEAETTLVEEAVDTEDSEDELLAPERSEGNGGASEERRPMDAALEIEVVRAIAEQFAEKLDQQKDLIYELRSEIQTKDIQLRLLPDLQRQVDEKQLAEFEKIALQKQLEQLQDENQKLKTQIEQKQPWWKAWFGASS